MDLLSGLVTANAPIGQQNPVGSYTEGATSALANNKAQIENTNAQYQQDLTMRLQKAIQESIGTNGNPDPVKLRQAGAKYGISAQTLDYTIAQMPKIWESAQKVVQSKNTIDAISPSGQKALTNTWASQPANAKRGGTLTAAPPTTNPEANPPQQQVQQAPAPEQDTTGFTTPDMQQTASGYNVSGSGVSGQGQTASDSGLTPNPSALEGQTTPDQSAANAQQMNNATEGDQNFFAQVNAIQPDSDTSTQPGEDTNHLQVADMPDWEKKAMKAQLQQEGRLSGTASDEDLQGVMDQDFQRFTATAGKFPSKNMFIDKDGKFDQGAYETAKSTYQANAAKAQGEFLAKEGGLYGQQFAQGMQKQANSRANQANAREKRTFDQLQEQISAARAQGYNANARNIDDIQTALANKASLQNAEAEVAALMPKAGKLGIDDFNASVAVIEKAMAQAAGTTTEAANDRLFASFRSDKTFGALAKEADGMGSFLKSVVGTKAGAQTQSRFLQLLQENLQAEERSGTNASKLDSYRIPWSKQPAKRSKKGSAGASAAAGKPMSAADRLKAKYGIK